MNSLTVVLHHNCTWTVLQWSFTTTVHEQFYSDPSSQLYMNSRTVKDHCKTVHLQLWWRTTVRLFMYSCGEGPLYDCSCTVVMKDHCKTVHVQLWWRTTVRLFMYSCGEEPVVLHHNCTWTVLQWSFTTTVDEQSYSGPSPQLYMDSLTLVLHHNCTWTVLHV
jgi:hypothetical protein